MTPTVNDTSFNSYYAGAKPSPSNYASVSRIQQCQAPRSNLPSPRTGSVASSPHSHLPSPRTGSLALNLKSSLPLMDPKFSSASTALKPSPLTPKDPNSMFIDDFSKSFEDDFDQIDNDCYAVGGENVPPRASSDVLCTAVFSAGGGENDWLTVKNKRAMEKKPVVRSPMVSEGWRLPFANRKRIIDEMFEDCGGGEASTPPPAKKSSSIRYMSQSSILQDKYCRLIPD